jgi:hypothetical protein
MKMPSLVPLPRHQKFRIEARYYDPVKEDIRDRTARIKHNLELERKEGIFQYHTSIRGSFSRRKDTNPGLSEVMLRMLIFALLLGGILGYIWYGPVMFYTLGAVMLPVYLVYRFKDFFRKKEV